MITENNIVWTDGNIRADFMKKNKILKEKGKCYPKCNREVIYCITDKGEEA